MQTLPQATQLKADDQSVSFLKNKIDALEALCWSRPSRKTTRPGLVFTAPNRNEWLQEVYKKGLVEVSAFTRDLADKLIINELLTRLLGADKEKFYPKTLGLKGFLLKHELVDPFGNLTSDIDQIRQAIQTEFPNGVVIKEAFSMNSVSEAYLWFNLEDFLRDLTSGELDLYSPSHLEQPYVFPVLKSVTSGEYLILQENVMSAAGESKFRPKEFMEIRLHTFEGKIVESATYCRWKENDKIFSRDIIQAAEAYTQSFLDRLPRGSLARQAFSIDVAMVAKDSFRVIEINTNRGCALQWTGFLSRPLVLGAYTRHIEKYCNLKFCGIAGAMLRRNLGNLRKYLYKKYFLGFPL